MEDEEIFKDIKGWGSRYQIGNHGTVISTAFSEMRILKHKVTKQGYHYISLPVGGGKVKSLGIGRLVAAAFVPNPNDYAEIVFIDGDKSNLHYTNLEWVGHDPNSRKLSSYVYHVWHKDNPEDIKVFTAVNHVVEYTKLSPLSVHSHMFRFPGIPGKSGWAIDCIRKTGFGYERISRK